MYKGLLSLILLTASTAIASERISVTFNNNSDKTLKCSSSISGQYTPFLRLHPEQSKSISAFSKGTKLRCYHMLTSNSTTPLTYFSATQAGTYELLMDRITCGKECSYGHKTRQATIAVPPDGQAIYNKMEGYVGKK